LAQRRRERDPVELPRQREREGGEEKDARGAGGGQQPALAVESEKGRGGGCELGLRG